MRAYVLHLTRAIKRRENAYALLENCGVAGAVWPAVDGAAMTPEDLATHYRRKIFAPAYPFELRVGEIGCFLSHRAIWADLQNQPENSALIIEDDAGIDPALLPDVLDLAERHIQSLGYIQLQTRAPRGPAQLIDMSGGLALTLPLLPGLRTTAQLVSKRAAAQLLAQSQVFDRPVDTWLQSHWHTGLRLAAIHPSGILEIADQMDGSTIQTARKGPLEKIKREALRTSYRIAARRAALRSDASQVGQDDGGHDD